MEQATQDWLQGLISVSTIAVVLWFLVLVWSSVSASPSYGKTQASSQKSVVSSNIVSKDLL
jgi:hypothetical protein